MENEKDIINLGEWNVPASWNDITLGIYTEIERYYADKDKKFDARDIIHILCNKSIDEVNMLPMDFTEKILEKLTWLQDKPEEKEATNKVIVSGVTYQINFQNKLKTGEYIAVDSVMKDDPHNYAAILAILCRKDGELYDSKFENEVLDDRIKMWEGVPLVDVMPLINFFLHLCVALQVPFLLSSQIKEGISHIRKDIETSARNGEISKHYMKSLMKKLTKLEKSINNM